MALIAPLTGHAQDWKPRVMEFRIGLLGGENTSIRLVRYDGCQLLLQDRLGLPQSHTDIHDAAPQGSGVGYELATMDLYKDIIALRETERRESQ